MEQGDVYLYTFRAPDKRRLVLVITRTSAIPYLNSVTIAPITTIASGSSPNTEVTSPLGSSALTAQ